MTGAREVAGEGAGQGGDGSSSGGTLRERMAGVLGEDGASACTTPAATQALAADVAAVLSGGAVLGLSGDLGAGKTCFVQGLARGLAVQDAASEVVSPTYTLVNVYPVAKPNPRGIHRLIHVDFYRMADAAAAQALGLEDLLGAKDAVTVVEWADHLPDLMPPGWVQLALERQAADVRRIRLV